MSSSAFSRRRFLQTVGLGSAAFALGDAVFLRDAEAEEGKPPRILVFCYFGGGWDQLMCLDPRPFAYDSEQADLFPRAASQIDPAYDQILDAAGNRDSAGHDKAIAYWVNSAAGKAAHGLVSLAGTSDRFVGPALYDTVLATDSDVAKRLCLVRGVNMGTLTHEVGRRYFITGKFPRGLQAAGSSLSTWVAYQNGAAGTPVPNLSVGVESYNEGLPAFASALGVGSAGDLVNVLKPFTPSATAPAAPEAIRQAAIEAKELRPEECWETKLDGDGLMSTLRASRTNALSMVKQNLSGLFTFSSTTTDADLMRLYSQFGIRTDGNFNNDVRSARGQALLAAQAITPRAINGKLVAVSSCVSLQLAGGIDDHDSDWGLTHGSTLRSGFDALGRLIRYLQQTPDPLVSGKSLFDRTLLMGFSEFARTPNINSRGGRDHHLANACLVAGAGIKGGVIGATRDADYGVQNIDPTSGRVSATGSTIRPSDIHATLLKGAGLSASHISNQQPQLLTAMLESP